MLPMSTFHTGPREDPVCVSFQEETAWSESLCVQMPAERTLPSVWVPHSVPPKSATRGTSGSSQHISYPNIVPPQVSSSFSSRAVYRAFTQRSAPSPSPLGSQTSRETDSTGQEERPRPLESPLLQLLLGSRPLAAAVTWGTDASLAQQDSRLTHAPKSKGCVVRS